MHKSNYRRENLHPTPLLVVHRLAAFRHLQVAGKQKINFLPLAFRSALKRGDVQHVACRMRSFISTAMFGIDINSVPTNFYSVVMIPGALLCCWTMYECQRYVDARDMIDEQLGELFHNED